MTTTDDPPPSLYAARAPIFPKRVSGRFCRLEWAIMIVTLGIYYLTPWLRQDRGPHLPDQAVLVDLADRRFFFFIEIWPHEVYFVAGLLIMAGLGLSLFTSALGRVWGGHACPQTVWTDLFIHVERRVKGDRNARIRLHRQPWDARKARLRPTGRGLRLAIVVATGGALVFYLADAPTNLVDLFTRHASFAANATVALLSATTVVFGGFVRQQICIYACPRPRRAARRPGGWSPTCASRWTTRSATNARAPTPSSTEGTTEIGEITGRKVLIFTVAAFSVVLAVNLTLAWQAVRTFPGLEVANSYVASQEFDDRRAAQEALGWQAGVGYAPGTLSVTLTAPDGRPAPVEAMEAVVGRPTTARDDITPAFTRAGSTFTAPADLAPGKWIVRLNARAADGTAFEKRMSLRVAAPGG